MTVPRIAIYGTGRYGIDVIKMAAARGWPIVAAYNRAGTKVGKDLADLAGLGRKYGVTVEDCDKADFSQLKGKADIAIVATTDRLVDNMPAFERLLAAGVNVLSHNTESYLPHAANPACAERIQALASEHGVTFTGTGIWDMSRIWSGILAAAPCVQIDSIIHSSRTNLGLNPKYLGMAGIGFTHEQFKNELIEQTGPIGELYKLIPWQVMEALGFEVTEVIERREPVVLETPIYVPALEREIPPGEPAGLRILVNVATAQGVSGSAHIEMRAVEADQKNFMNWTIKGEPESVIQVDRQVGPPGSTTSIMNRVIDIIRAPAGIQEVHRLGPPRHSALDAAR